jgi:hypothetical protein
MFPNYLCNAQCIYTMHNAQCIIYFNLYSDIKLNYT